MDIQSDLDPGARLLAHFRANARRLHLDEENSDLRAQVARLKSQRAAMLRTIIQQARGRKSLRERLAASQDRELSRAAELDAARADMAQARCERDRSEEIVIGAMRHVLASLGAIDLELVAVRRDAYRQRLGLSDVVIQRFDAAALAVERIRRGAMRAPALA